MKWIITLFLLCFITLQAQEPITSFMGIEFGTSRLEAMKVIKEKYNAEYQRANKGTYYFTADKDNIYEIKMKGEEGIFYGGQINRKYQDKTQWKNKFDDLKQEIESKHGQANYKLENEFETKYLWLDDSVSYVLMKSSMIDEFYIYEICTKLNDKDKEEIDIEIIKSDWEEMKND